MAAETLILRFRDLVTDPTETITSHKAIIDEAEYTWWAWWHKMGEKVPAEVFSELVRGMRDDGALSIYLMDSGQELLYEAACEEIRWPNHGGRESSPDRDRTPEYYRERNYKAWFKLTGINPDPVADPNAVLQEWAYVRVDDFFEAGESNYGVFYDKRIHSPAELRQQDRTIWFVRRATAEHPNNEVTLVGARTTMPSDFVTDPVDAPSATFLWLSDVHFDATGEHHAFALAPEFGRRMLGQALEEDVQAADVEQLGGVIVSGDLTWRASDDDYALAKGLLRNIQSWSALGKDPAAFVVCPGNHDLAFSNDPASKDDPVTATLAEARAPYERFYTEFFQRGPNESLAMGRRYLVEKSRVVDVVALNTSLLQQHEDLFQGQGYVGDAQLDAVAAEMGWDAADTTNRAYRVLVLHHHVIPIVARETPVHGRQYSLLLDAGAVLRWSVMHRVDLILHGHMHQPYCGMVTLPIQSTGALNETHTMGLVALPSTGVGERHRGDIGQNLFGLIDFLATGVRVQMFTITSNARRNRADPPHLERTFPYLINP